MSVFILRFPLPTPDGGSVEAGDQIVAYVVAREPREIDDVLRAKGGMVAGFVGTWSVVRRFDPQFPLFSVRVGSGRLRRSFLVEAETREDVPLVLMRDVAAGDPDVASNVAAGVLEIVSEVDPRVPGIY